MYIGIDLGGTNTAAAIVGSDGAIIKKAGIPTSARLGPEAVAAGLLRVCGTLTDGADARIQAIGIGVPGMADARTGEVIFTPNLPLAGFNIADGLREKYGVPVYIENDANCAALGEIYFGGLRDAENAVFITLGTGVGGGVVLNRRIYTGRGAAGEFGHMVIYPEGRECGCGRRGCWETYASATGLIKTARELMESHKTSAMWELCGGNAENVDGRTPFEAMRAGDNAAHMAVRTYIKHLAAGIANIINILHPDAVCLGGGVANAGEILLESLREAVDAEIYTRFLPREARTRVTAAELGSDAGMIGAAMLGKR